MKAFMAMMIIMVVGLGTTNAAPAAPVWTSSAIASGLHDQNFSANHFTPRRTSNSGIRFQLGYNFASNAVPGFENRMIMVSIDKQLSENWWVTAGYQGGLRQVSLINAGAAYTVSPNVAVSIGYILETKYDMKNAIFRTQLDIYF